ncbi:MAG: isoprenylcysteine carboxylmethyltransferase family protein [Acidobacteriaceae bacterium]|nr:isoprenylcysteine carboxylmethyltransferase family protein [Acidobacteriaceae bacterium]
MRWSKPYADRVAKLRVPCGFVLVLTFAWLSRPTPASLLWGVPVSIAGLALRAWAAGHLEKNTRLTWSGPYAFVRNPLYIGTLLVAAGLVIASRRWILAGIFAAVFLFVYLPVIELEEQHLRDLFPEFATYAARVNKLIPRWPQSSAERRFRWSLYKRNREYEAALGFVAGLAFLIAKILFTPGS